MSKLLDIILDIDFENVCRLCLSQHGVMSNIYDSQKQSILSDRIVSLASVQVLPDDGLPGLICQVCVDKVEKCIKFREQIENSYYLLCQCIGIDPNETDSNYVNRIPSTSGKHSPSPKSKEKSPRSTSPQKLTKDNVEQDVSNSLSSLFKDHLVSGISNDDLLVNPQDGYINVNNVSYSCISDDVYKTADNYMSIALADEGMVDSQQSALLTKDLNAEIITDAGFNIKLNDSGSDAKIYNISFSDNQVDNSEALHDIFQVLDNDVEGQNGFDDITKFLKSSQTIDFKKLKEEIKIIKDKNERNECDVDIDPDRIIKKLASRGVTFVKKENATDCGENVSNLRNDECTLATQSSSNCEESDLIDLNIVKSDDVDNDTPDIIFARMPASEREIYTKGLSQEEIAPRVTEIHSIVLDHRDSSQITEGRSDKELLKFNTYLCNLCLADFRECERECLTRHAESHFTCGGTMIQGCLQNEPLFECEICGERFNDRHFFVIHQRKHLGIRPFICSICYKSFVLLEKLTEHMTHHTKVKDSNQFPCFYCGKIYKKKQELQYHERTHMDTAPLVCTTCNKTFSNLITLKMHKKRHTEGTKHCCEVCGKAFFSSTQLKRHEQSHLGVRRFPCNFCTKAFYSNAERRRHLLYHFKTKKFKCVECDKAFYESGHLTIHMRTHTNFKPYICDVCGKGFPTRVKLMRHLKMHEKHNLGSADIRDKLMLRMSMPDAAPKTPKSRVTPKFTRLNPANKKVNTVNMLGGESSHSNSLVAVDILNNLGLNGLQDDEEESYIIIEEGEDSNGDEVSTDLASINGVQVFTDDSGQVFYVLDDEEFSTMDDSNTRESANM